MHPRSWFIDLDQVGSSYLVLLALAGLVLTGGLLFYFGLLGWAFRAVGFVVTRTIGKGFRLWEGLLSWAPWPPFLALALGCLLVGGVAGRLLPGLRILCGLAPLVMGTVACLAYMFIDQERYEVERGYKATHDPLKGQGLAPDLARYGEQVNFRLLIAATVAAVGGFAMLNQGLYETVGQDWFKVGDEQGGANYADFLAYALINLLRIVDVLNVTEAQHVLRAEYVHQQRWPASVLLAGFRIFFTFVLLQQLFASLRQGNLLAGTIDDFWSPHEPIHERARNALPQYGTLAIGPLLLSLRSVGSLTREQRDQLPLILSAIGPSIVPALVRHLQDPHEHVRAVAAASLGQLRAVDALPQLVALSQDPSEMVRQSLVEALGVLGGDETEPARAEPELGPASRRRWFGWLSGWKKRAPLDAILDPVEVAVAMLACALADNSAAVRTQATLALGRIGSPAAAVAPGLIALLKDADETVRCHAATALGQVGGEPSATVAALVELLQDASPPVKASAARALGALKTAAAPAVPALAPLLQDREESVRTAAAEAIAQVGPLSGAATATLAEGLTSADTTVRAQTARALGTIGAAATASSGALVAALADRNDRVRGRAVEALGKIGESAAAVAVPGLVRALRDKDNWVSALAAEALGEMGGSADEAGPALVRSLGHLNPQVRANAAAALGKMGSAAGRARTALEKACRDEDGGARSQAVRALGLIGRPTPASEQVILAALQDPDPLVRAAAVESLGQWGEPSAAALSGLAPLLEDTNDQVKVEATRVLPRLAGATPAVIDGLCRRLLEDDSAWVQVHAALALGKLGPAAVAAGGPLLRAAQTGELSVREQAMRALAMIQPPEMLAAFTAGLEDANADIRKVASGGWMGAASIPEAVIPFLVVALRDPEVTVRANAAHALARLDALPTEAIPLLIACTGDLSDALRINAALALEAAPGAATTEAMRRLLEDANGRIRLIAAGSLLAAAPADARAGAVVVEALSDPVLRMRKAALDLVESLGTRGEAFLEALKMRSGLEEEGELRDVLARLIERLGTLAETAPPPIAD